MDKIKRILFITFSAAVLLLAACKHDVTTGTVKVMESQLTKQLH